MRVLRFTVPSACDGQSLRQFARGYLGFSARILTEQKQLKNGILRNGKPCRTIDILSSGDELEFSLPEEKMPKYEAVPCDLEILWENEDFLTVHKPANMPIHPSSGHNRDSLLNAVAYYYKKSKQNHVFRPLYRLDRDTTGIVLLAKNRVAAQGAVLEKTYFSVCQGILMGEGCITLPIGLEPGSKIRRTVGHGQQAETKWTALAHGDDHTLLVLRLGTGRTHQIRVHMAALGHPLAGDDFYGGDCSRIHRQALHCGELVLTHPLLDLRKTVHCGFPQDIIKAFPWCERL